MTKQDTHKIQEALDLLNAAAHEQKDDIGELLKGKYEALKDVVQGLETEAVDAAKHGAERLSELKDSATERVKETAQNIDQKVHDDPWKTLGLPILGAFVVGYLLGRKD